MPENNPKPKATESLQQHRLLEAAMATFLRFGYRKTSMEEIARAAHISRQGLYLHFPTKEDLFSAAARHLLDTCLQAATDAIARGTTIEEKLVGAFDEWVGRHAGIFGTDLADLQETADHLIGAMHREREEAFLASITALVRSSGLSAAYAEAGIEAGELAQTLAATAAGLKHRVRSREEFAQRIGIAVRALCIPLRTPR